MMTNGKPYILVVEDDAPVRNLITTTLESQNYKYMAAANGNQAVMSAASGSPDIILMDLGLPGYGRRGRDQEDTHLVRGSDYR